MGVDIAIHAERRAGDGWSAADTVPEAYVIGGRTLYEWVESRSLFYGRDRHLSRIFRRLGDAARHGQHPRGFPPDMSAEVLMSAAPVCARDWMGRDEGLIRSQVALANASQSWLLLDELLGHGWDHIDAESYEVGKTYAELAGERFMTEALPALRSYGAGDAVRIIYWLLA